MAFTYYKTTPVLHADKQVVAAIRQSFHLKLEFHVCRVVFIAGVTVASDALSCRRQLNALITKHAIGMHIVRDAAGAMGVHDFQ